MTRPRFTLTRIALAGAGLLAAAGIGTAVIPAAISSTPAAAATGSPTVATTSPSTTTPTPGATTKAGEKTGAKARLRRLGIAVHRLLVREVAKDTGMTVKQVRAQLRSGHSLYTIAGAKAQSVESAVMATITTRLDAARTAGKITQAQETKLEAKAQKVVDRMMARTPKVRAPKATPAA